MEIHGESRTKEYYAWKDMVSRCHNQNHKAYKYYGGRGIQVCDRWEKYQNFKKDIGLRPANLTLERVDNDGNYEPNNCKWASRKEQAYNRSNNKKLTYHGITKTLYQWAEIAGIGHILLLNE